MRRRVATDEEEECTGDVYLICEMRGLCELKVNNQYLALTFGSKASATLAANMLNIVRNAEKDEEEEDHP